MPSSFEKFETSNMQRVQEVRPDPQIFTRVLQNILAQQQEVETREKLKVELSQPEYTKRFAEAPIYAKQGEVKARQAQGREPITTVLADGTVETTNVAEAGDMIVVNPGGEKYIMSAEKFTQRYQATDEAGVFSAKSKVRAFRNPTGQSIEITAPWGEKQIDGPDCMLVASFDPENPSQISSTRYIVGAEEFEETYFN